VSGRTVDLSNLRDRPEFLDIVADRIWRAWWKREGAPLSDVADALLHHGRDAAIPTTFVAHKGATFIGTASLIQNDLADRPHLSPWVAALWVEPSHRRGGFGGALLEHAAGAAFASGAANVYLCAAPKLDGYYLGRGWTLVETEVGEYGLSVFKREAPKGS